MDFKTFEKICNGRGISVREIREEEHGYELYWKYGETHIPSVDIIVEDGDFENEVIAAWGEYSPEGTTVEIWSNDCSYDLRAVLDDEQTFNDKLKEIIDDMKAERLRTPEEMLRRHLEKRAYFVNLILSESIEYAFDYVHHIKHGGKLNDEFVTIACENGTEYRVNVTMDSLGAIIEDVTRECLKH